MIRALLLAAAVAIAAPAGAAAAPPRTIRALAFEFVGQFQNSPAGVTPATHSHYGYLSYVQGLAAFDGTTQDETTALFTFYAEAATTRVIANGPLRVITRVGKLTIFRDASTNGDFGKPDTFRDGTPVLVAGFRQQVVLDTITNAFTTFHRNTITATTPFSGGKRSVRLGVVGETFRVYLNGHANMPGPPSGWLGGYAVSG